MPDSLVSSSVTQHLAKVVSDGRELALRSGTSMGAAQVWIFKARVALAKVYGNDASEIGFWCPLQSADPATMPAQDKILTRLPSLERLLSVLAVPPTPKVFIGHGQSPEWLKLRIFLTESLGVRCDEFNIEPTAGLQTANRIASMLASAQMAFLVMTGDDEHADGTRHARENVIHEIGLFQARLGAERAIVLLESDCSRFSNLDGLTTVNFPRGDILARSEEIRRVLIRERMLSAGA